MQLNELFHNAVGHTKTVLTHKYYVLKYMWKAGYYWRGLMHDMSKFSPIEFFESIKYYTGTASPIVACKKDKGYSEAWQHHKGRNRHHYEYWVDKLDDGGVPIKMPYDDVVELVCDYIAAGQAYQKDKFTYCGEYSWWRNKISKEHIKIHLDTEELIDRILYTFATKEAFDPAVLKECKEYLKY